MEAKVPTSWMMTVVKLEEKEEEEEEEIVWREVKLSETDSEEEKEAKGCRRKAVPEELRDHDYLWDGMFAPNPEKIPKEETEEFPLNAAEKVSVKEEVGYKTIQQIDFTSAKTKKRKMDSALITGDTPAPLKQRKLPDVMAPTSEELSIFYRDLHKLTSKGQKPVILSLLPNYAQEYWQASLDKKYPLVLSELFDENDNNAKKKS